MTLTPANVDDIQEIVRSHAAIEISAGQTKSPTPRRDAVALNLAALRGITEYSADECVLTAYAGTTLHEIAAALQAHGQYLPFDPPLVDAGATIGGTVASAASGSGRYRYGGVRDFLIGARVVDGAGRLIRTGGKVVKNAAGFLLHHALVGSAGRFGVITEVTLKVFPLPEAWGTLRVECGNVANAITLARIVEARRFDLACLDFDGQGTMWIRIAGRASALRTRGEQLRAAVAPRDADWLEGDHDAAIWTAAQDWGSGHDPCAKVVGNASSWPQLCETFAHMRLMAAGAFAICRMGDLTPTPAQLAAAGFAAPGLNGIIVTGPDAGTRLGPVPNNPFEERVRRVLDPQDRFRAAPHTS
ncbi:MAG TPA: FAD-binding protein [Vicinamibacterales bacterium]|nr:FAD-binding protein [Vicinamibacterales bacterium]